MRFDFLVARLRLRRAKITPTNGVYAWERESEDLKKVRTLLLGKWIGLIG